MLDPQRRARWSAVTLYAAVLFVASVVPSPLGRHPEFDRVGPDKALHLLGHAGFAALVADALAADGVDARGAAVLSAGLSVAYGYALGRLQERVPGRVGERADLVAGAVGSVLGVLGWRYTDRSGR